MMTNNSTVKPTSKFDGELPQEMDDFKDLSFKYNLSKFEYDLYHEEDDISQSIIRVKRFDTVAGERWKIFENGKEKFVVEGFKLTKKQKTYLRSVDGVNFMINLFKNGIRSFNHFKTELKNELK